MQGSLAASMKTSNAGHAEDCCGCCLQCSDAAMLVVVSCLQQGRCAWCAADVSRTAVAAAGTHTCATRAGQRAREKLEPGLLD